MEFKNVSQKLVVCGYFANELSSEKVLARTICRNETLNGILECHGCFLLFGLPGNLSLINRINARCN